METEPKLHLPESPTPDGHTDGRTAPPAMDGQTNGHTVPPTPDEQTDERTAPPTPDGQANGHTAPPTPDGQTDGRTAPPTPDGRTARRAFARPASAIALALLSVLALNELIPTSLLLFRTPFLPLIADTFAGFATGKFLETLLLLAGIWGRLCAVLFLTVTAVGSWLVFDGAFRRSGGMQSAGLALVRVGVVLGGVSSVLYGVDGVLRVGADGLLAGVGVFAWFAVTVLLCVLFFRLTGGMKRVVRGEPVRAYASFRLSAAVLLFGGALVFALAVLSFFGVVRDASPLVLPFAFGFSSLVLSLLSEQLAGLALAAELFAFAAFLLRFRKAAAQNRKKE